MSLVFQVPFLALVEARGFLLLLLALTLPPMSGLVVTDWRRRSCSSSDFKGAAAAVAVLVVAGDGLIYSSAFPAPRTCKRLSSTVPIGGVKLLWVLTRAVDVRSRMLLLLLLDLLRVVLRLAVSGHRRLSSCFSWANSTSSSSSAPPPR